MTRELLIEASPGELRAYLVEDGRLQDFRIERDVGAPRLGEIWLGRVASVLPALPGAMVDLGTDRPALLDAADMVTKQTMAALHEGQSVIVQVRRDAQGGKSAGVTMRPRLVGRHAVFRPFAAEVSRVEPRGVSTEAQYAADLQALEERWGALLDRAKAETPPLRLDAIGGALEAILSDLAEEAGAIIFDDRPTFAAAKGWCAAHRPAAVASLAYEGGAEALSERHGVAEEAGGLLAPRVELPQGGALTIEPVTAVTFIDVDSDRASGRRDAPGAMALAVNLAAAQETARQIRLRNLSGSIVVDFISMTRREHRDDVMAAFRDALSRDPALPEVKGWTRLGHIELTRRRTRPPLSEVLYERRLGGGLVPTGLTLALAILRGAAREGAAHPSGALRVTAHPAVAAILDGPAREPRLELEKRLGRPLHVLADPGRDRESFDIGPA